MKLAKKDFYNYIKAYEEDEIFYRNLYEAEQKSPQEFQVFLKSLNPDYLEERELFVPALDGEWLKLIREESFFFSLTQDIKLAKHFRYSPLFEHGHEFFEVLYVYEGTCSNTIQGKTHQMRQGDLCIIPPRTTHSVGIFDDSIAINIMVKSSTFQSTFFQLFVGDNALSHFFTHVLYKKTQGNYLIFHAGDDQLIRSAIEDLFIEDLGHEKYSRPILNNLLMLFWGQLLRRHEEHIDSFLSAEHGSLQITEVLSYLQENMCSLTLQKAADHFGFSVPHFSKLLKDSTGKTYTMIMKEARMARACRALITTDLSVQSICELSGYSNPEHFMRTFKKEFSMTPSQYRKLHS